MVPLAATWRDLIQPFSEMQCLRSRPVAKSLTQLGSSFLTFEKAFKTLHDLGNAAPRALAKFTQNSMVKGAVPNAQSGLSTTPT
jgi:hypothetical protein